MIGARRIYRPSVPENYEWALPADDVDNEAIWTLAGRRPGQAWDPIRMTLLKVDSDHGSPYRRADLPWLGSHTLVLRDQAIDRVGEILRPYGELLPLLCDDARLTLFSAPPVAGVLDENRSEVVRFSTGGIMSIRRHAFRLSALEETMAFKLVEMPRGNLYLTDRLVDAILATGMTAGTEFVPVYDAAAE